MPAYVNNELKGYPGYTQLALVNVVAIPTSPEFVWEILLRNVELTQSSQLLALSASGADGSGADVTGYVWEMGGLASNSTTADNQIDGASTRDGWRLLFSTNLAISKIRGRLLWDPGACTLDWVLSGVSSGLSAGKRGSGHRAATNRRSLLIGASGGATCNGTILYRPLV